jgi:hypothetical protein
VSKRALALGVALVSSPGCDGSSSGRTEKPVVAAPAADNVAQLEEALAAIVATCAEALGNVEVRRKGQPHWDQVAVGVAFRERDWVRTGAGGFARLRFAAGGFLDLRQNTTILVDRAIGIESGSLVGVAETGAEPIIIKAADGSEARIVASADGPPAEFRLTPSSEAGLEIAVTKGNLNVITREGERAVAAGEASDLRQHRAGEVVKLLGFPKSLWPGVDARFLFAGDKQVALKWAPVPGAARYHAQIAYDTEFRDLVLDADTTTTGTSFSPDAVGIYVWRAAAIDAKGRLGEFGFARRIFFEQEPPHDLLLSPHDGIKVGFSDKHPRIMFSWQSAGDTKRYKLVIGRGDAPTSDPVVSIPTPRQQITVTTLREGTYRWGVYAVRGKEEIPIFIEPRELTIRKQRVKAKTDKLWDKPAH